MKVPFNTKDMNILHAQTSLTSHRFVHSQSLDRKEMFGGKYKVESITNNCTQLSTAQKHNSSNKLYYAENSPSLQLDIKPHLRSCLDFLRRMAFTLLITFTALPHIPLRYPLPRTGHWRAYDITRVSRYLLLLNLH